MTSKIYTNTKTCRILNRKGFHERKGRQNHLVFELIVDGVITRIRTRVSHTRKGNITANLKKKMAKQLRMDGGNQFNDFLDCTYTLQQYLNDLRENGIIQ